MAMSQTSRKLTPPNGPIGALGMIGNAMNVIMSSTSPERSSGQVMLAAQPSGDREGADAGGAAAGLELARAPAALEPDQQPDAECNGKAGDQVMDIHGQPGARADIAVAIRSGLSMMGLGRRKEQESKC